MSVAMMTQMSSPGSGYLGLGEFGLGNAMKWSVAAGHGDAGNSRRRQTLLLAEVDFAAVVVELEAVENHHAERAEQERRRIGQIQVANDMLATVSGSTAAARQTPKVRNTDARPL